MRSHGRIAPTTLLTGAGCLGSHWHLESSWRDLPDRQRTLRAAIDWSYDLLAGPEQAFFRRLSTFSGGAELDAIQAVVDPAGALSSDPLDFASALVDRSLLRSTHMGGPAGDSGPRH